MTRDHRSRAELEAAVADLEGETDAGVREVGIIGVLSSLTHGGTLDAVDTDRRLYQLNGERVRLRESVDDVLGERREGR